MPPKPTLRALAACLCLAPGIALADPAALVIGNSNYRDLPDVRTAGDIRRLADRLGRAGVTVRVRENAGTEALATALAGFEADAGDREGAVVYLAGRFVHSRSDTYFLAADARATSLEAVRREGLPLSTLLPLLAASGGRAVLALGDGGAFEEDADFLDAGIGPLAVPQGVTVLTGPPDDLRTILAAAVEGEAVLDPEALRATDVALSGFVPWDGRLPLSATAAAAPDPRDGEIAYWEAVRGLDTIEGYENYLGRYPRGVYAAEAAERIAALRDAPRREAEAAEAALELNREQRREIQRALTLLGYDPRGIDGIFGRGTRSAIGAFQSAEGYAATGYLDREQIRRLDRLARARSEELEAEARREAERAAEADRRYWRQTGASGREDDLRRYLDRYPDGIFSDDARAELRAIEDARRPEVSAVERLTWQQAEADGSADAYREYLRRYPDGAYAGIAREEIARLESDLRGGNDRRIAERGEEQMNLSVGTRRTIEARLEALNYGPGRVDGIFDDRTRTALLRYQRDRGLPATGYMNDPTMVRILADTVISIFD